MTPPRTTPVIAALALVALTACGTGDAALPTTTGDAAATAAANPVTVDVVNIAYKPAELRVLRGTKVTWVNADAGVAHTVTSGLGGSNAVAGVSDGDPSKPDGVFGGQLPVDGSFAFTFNASGTFPYFCEIHPSMRGAVVVE